MEEDREGTGEEEGGEGERGKWGRKGGGCPCLCARRLLSSGQSKSPRRTGRGSGAVIGIV